MVTFVIGGARSGKSGFALQKASAAAGSKAYIATAQALDDEMRERIARHQQERTDAWTTIEEPLNLAASLTSARGAHSVLLVDCLTLWVSNLLVSEIGNIEERTDEFIAALEGSNGCAVYVVANEVGLGIVPDNLLARRFRDLAGALNQKVAAVAGEVFLVTAGIPLRIK
ncbi:MAG: bifunctional adenosylcobinamide kinase/adenosylcobinamide-phosphate guanylyltransferase [Nitrospirota bacterium]